MLGLMQSAGALLTYLLVFSSLGALAAPTPPGALPAHGHPGHPRGHTPESVGIVQPDLKIWLKKVWRYAAVAYCLPEDVKQHNYGCK
jgi:hypothetical protein